MRLTGILSCGQMVQYCFLVYIVGHSCCVPSFHVPAGNDPMVGLYDIVAHPSVELVVSQRNFPACWRTFGLFFYIWEGQLLDLLLAPT
jgi:hypothetical protein